MDLHDRYDLHGIRASLSNRHEMTPRRCLPLLRDESVTRLRNRRAPALLQQINWENHRRNRFTSWTDKFELIIKLIDTKYTTRCTSSPYSLGNNGSENLIQTKQALYKGICMTCRLHWFTSSRNSEPARNSETPTQRPTICHLARMSSHVLAYKLFTCISLQTLHVRPNLNKLFT